MHAVLVAALCCASAACDSDSGAGTVGPQAGSFVNPAPCGSPPAVNEASEAASWQCIGPSGGEVLVPGPEGHKLVIPPGALPEPVRITIKRHHNIHNTSLYLLFEPEGLEFSTPVTFKLANAAPTTGGDPLLVGAYHGSSLHETVSLGSELTNWVPAKVVGYDEAARQWSIELEHFSTLNAIVGVNELAYLVVSTGKYTRPGDILFALTTDGESAPSWNTGHVGMFSGVYPYPSDTVQPVVVESTVGGVRSISYKSFRTETGHIYVGARRPKGAIVDDEQRKTALTFAHLQRRNNAGYSLAGFGAFDSFSCVGLVEESLDTIGRGVLGYAGEFFGGTPHGMWEETVPVEDVVVTALEPVDIPVYTVQVDPSNLVFFSVHGGYRIASNSVTQTGKPDAATFAFEDKDRAYHIKWTPALADVGTSHTITFNSSGSINAVRGRYDFDVTTSINLKVSGIQHDFTVMPNTTTVQGYTYSYYATAPKDAEFRSYSLIDVETNTPASQNVFPNHTFQVIHEGWSTQRPDLYGITFQVRNPSGVPVPGLQPRTWRYLRDHTSGFWNGDLEAPQ